MSEARSRRLQKIPLVAPFVVALALVCVIASSCGESIAENALEEAIEQAAESGGEDVEVDIDQDNHSVSVSDENGETNWQTGEDVALPDGFPTDLVPQGAEVISAITTGESQTVIFATSDGVDETYDFYLDALPAAGYGITTKMQMDSEEEPTFAVAAESADTSIMVSGGSDYEGESHSYQVTLQPKK